MMRLLLSIFLIFSTSGCFNSKGLSAKQVDGKLEQQEKSRLDHSGWDKLLQKHVRENGNVDYEGFKKDSKKLEDYLDYLNEQEPNAEWSVSEQLAYYINAYNAYTIKLIIDHYPVKSIKDIGGIGGPFVKKFVKLGGKTFSLAGLEKGILQKMKEPRIHFAINCASFSCPKLSNRAYLADNMDKQLNKAASDFINSEKNDISENSVTLSRIFDWYESDFTHSGLSLIAYINQFSETQIKPGANLNYKSYDWSLNNTD